MVPSQILFVEMCSVIKNYTEQSTAVLHVFLDNRNAFDRVNHWTLFVKLIDTQAPLLTVRVLLFWYQMQNVCIKRGNAYSLYFTIYNGVRQGVPRLFALYVNQLTDELLSCDAGCYIKDMCINHVMYADDICLLAPSASAMHRCLMYVMIMVAIMIFCSILLNRYVLFLNLRHANCISRLFLLVQMP